MQATPTIAAADPRTAHPCRPLVRPQAVGVEGRLQQDLLERAGRLDESREWMRKAAVSDIEGVTDAEERVEEEAGLAFTEEEYAPEGDPGQE